MNKFFNSAIERFDKLKGRDFLINPISRFDAEIIIELGQILKKAGLVDVLLILDSYKKDKDEETRDSLLQWNIDHPNLGIRKLVDKMDDKISGEIDGEEEEYKPPPFFKIGDLLLREFHIKSLKKFERFDENRNDYVYGLILNPMPEGFSLKGVPPFANEIIEYSTEENRTTVLENLSAFFKDIDVDTIDLESNE